MKRFVLICQLIFITVNLSAQAADPIGSFNRYVIESWAGQYQRVGQYKVKGTQFLFGESFPGKIKYAGDDFMLTPKILYDLQKQLAGPEASPGNIFIADNKVLEEFVIELTEKYGSEVMHFRTGASYGIQKNSGYFRVLVDGSVVGFVRQYKVQLTNDPSNPQNRDAKIFEQYAEYYIFNPKGKLLHKVKLHKKDILGALDFVPGAADKAAAMGVDFTMEAGVISLLQTLNAQ